MTTAREIVHIHEGEGEPCIIDGTEDDGVAKFTTDATYWNTLNTSCAPTTRLRPDFTISGRADPRTSALKGERRPYRK